MNSKAKGNIAVGRAINYYLSKQVDVALPLCDNRPYDLIKEADGQLKKVQCKYTTQLAPSKSYVVSLRVTGGNQSFYTAKKYKKGDFDFLFVCTVTNELYEIPFDVIQGKSSITLCSAYATYLLK